MESRIIEDVESLAALAEAWNGLLGSIRHPFQELGWYASWARTIGTTEGRRLKIMTLWDANRLAAVWPLTLRRYKGIRLLEWVGARVTDYGDVTIHPDLDSRNVLPILWRELRHRVGFDVLRLGQVRGDAVVNGLMDNVHHWVETREASFGFPLTWATGEDWLASRNKHQRGNFRRQSRQIQKLGYEFKVWQSPERAVLEAAIEQKQAWVRARGVGSFITEPQGPEFVHAMARQMSAHGSLHLSAVCSAERMAACHVGFVRGDTFYFYMPTYDAAFAKQGVGSMLRESLIMWACDQGLKKFDLLLGASDYKLQYGAAEEPVRTLVVPRGLIGRAAMLYYQRLAAARSGPANGGAAPPEPA